jgi:hypothetical protein
MRIAIAVIPGWCPKYYVFTIIGLWLVDLALIDNGCFQILRLSY